MFASYEAHCPKASSVYLEGGVIYSYGEHFPMAVWLLDGTCAVNEDKYSVTTGKHMSNLHSAISGREKRYFPTKIMCQLARIRRDTGDRPNVVVWEKTVPPKNLPTFEEMCKQYLKGAGVNPQKTAAMLKKWIPEVRKITLIENI
jgi:hypothetical protein